MTKATLTIIISLLGAQFCFSQTQSHAPAEPELQTQTSADIAPHYYPGGEARATQLTPAQSPKADSTKSSTISLANKSKADTSRHSNIKLAFELGSYISKDRNTPFWMSHNQGGIIPNDNFGLASLGISRDYNPQGRKFQFSYGAEVSAYSGTKDKEAIISQLYANLRWGKLQIDLGVKHRKEEFHGLSSTNGNILWSGNSRSYPGYCLSLTDYIHMFFMPKWLSIKMEYGDYILNDNRYMGNSTRLHHKNFFFKARLSKKTSLIAGLDHYCQWAGESERHGKQPHGFKDYLRVITSSEGGSNALETDQINAIGNHVGAWSLRVEHKGKTDWTFFYSHPFDDRSGREFQNYPDGNYGIFIDTKKEHAFINSFVYDFTYTMHQSGPRHDRIRPDGTKEMLRGNDNYFNNSVFKSGFTYFNRVIASPFFIVKPINNEGLTLGLTSTRFIAHHIGLRGQLLKNLNYQFKCSYVRSYGQHHAPFTPTHKDFHGIYELEYAPKSLPFSVKTAIAHSKYSEQDNAFGGYLKLLKRF